MEQAIDSWTIVPDAPASSLIPEQALPASSSNVPSAPPAEQGMLSIRRTEAWQQEQGPVSSEVPQPGTLVEAPIVLEEAMSLLVHEGVDVIYMKERRYLFFDIMWTGRL